MKETVRVQMAGEGNIAVASFGSSCISNAEEIASACERLKGFIEDNRPDNLIFDFDGVKFFSSQVLGLILDVRARVRDYRGEVSISSINPQLHRVFKITNLDKIFRFFPSKDSAVRQISGGGMV